MKAKKIPHIYISFCRWDKKKKDGHVEITGQVEVAKNVLSPIRFTVRNKKAKTDLTALRDFLNDNLEQLIREARDTMP